MVQINNTRRHFFKKFSFLLSSTFFVNACTNNNTKSLSRPIVVSTWDSGLPVNAVAWKVLKEGGTSIDAVEQGANHIENSINCCVGLGGNPDRDGIVTLDACIMDHQYNCGSVAYVRGIKNPISLARKVMELTPHVMLVGEGAVQFAKEVGFEIEAEVLSPDAQKTYGEWLEKSEYKPKINIELEQNPNFIVPKVPSKLENGEFNHDTMGLLAIDAKGNLSGACTTSGMGFKMHGRVGDSPIIGAGLYVDNEIGAATSSGQGEEVIRIAGTHLVVELMRQGHEPRQACKIAIERLVNINKEKALSFQVGFLAVNKYGDHGAYAIHPGFVYSVTDGTIHEVIKSDAHFEL